jgi:hypothetical protein
VDPAVAPFGIFAGQPEPCVSCACTEPNKELRQREAHSAMMISSEEPAQIRLGQIE